jgi:hypothetical protein
MRSPGLTGDIWPDEIQELLLQAALLPGDRGEAAWASVRPRIDVDHLPGELHRLMPLLWKALSDRGADHPDLARLKGVYQYGWYRNTMLLTDAAALLGELSTATIPTMLLRGAAIGVAYRGDVAARPMNDVDILVPETDLERARDVAALAGWRPLDRSRPLERRLAAAPVRNSSGRVVRLHWQPSPHLALSGGLWDGVWQRARQVQFHGREAFVPSAADHLVHVCADGARANSGSSLRWITDATALLTTPGTQVDWDVVVSEARRLHFTLLMSEALRYLTEALDAEVPQPVFAALGASPVTSRERVAHRLSVTTTPRVPSAAEILGRFARLTADRQMLDTAAAAPEFLATVLEVQRHQLPVAILKKITRVIISPSPPLASLSTTGSTGLPFSDGPRKGSDASRLSTR